MALQQQLDSLEEQLGLLVAALRDLNADNIALRRREQELSKECAHLHKKNATATLQIEAIIAQLKQTVNPVTQATDGE